MQIALFLVTLFTSVATAWWIGYGAGYKNGYNQCLTDDYRALYKDRKEWEFKQERLN